MLVERTNSLSLWLIELIFKLNDRVFAMRSNWWWIRSIASISVQQNEGFIHLGDGKRQSCETFFRRKDDKWCVVWFAIYCRSIIGYASPVSTRRSDLMREYHLTNTNTMKAISQLRILQTINSGRTTHKLNSIIPALFGLVEILYIFIAVRFLVWK